MTSSESIVAKSYVNSIKRELQTVQNVAHAGREPRVKKGVRCQVLSEIDKLTERLGDEDADMMMKRVFWTIRDYLTDSQGHITEGEDDAVQ